MEPQAALRRNRLLPALLLALYSFTSTGAVESGRDLIRWRPVGQASNEAGSSGKPLLYFFTADWCGPCHLMKAEIFADKELAALIEKEYIPVQVLDRTRETGKNVPEIDKLFAKFEIRGFPTLVVTQPKSTNAVYVAGWPGKERVSSFLKTVKEQLREMDKAKKGKK